MMRLQFILFIIIGFTLKSWAQNSHLIFYTEDGQKFKVKLNGSVQSEETATRVKVKYYNERGGKVKIIFEDASIPAIESELKFQTGMIVYWLIKKKGEEYIIEWNRELPYNDRDDDDPDHLHIHYLQPNGERVAKPLTGKEYLEQYSGKKGCETPMTFKELRIYQEKINDFPLTKVQFKTAIAELDDKCFSISQVKSMIEFWPDDVLRADYAIAVYSHTYNQDDFMQAVHLIHDMQQRERVIDALGLK